MLPIVDRNTKLFKSLALCRSELQNHVNVPRNFHEIHNVKASKNLPSKLDYSMSLYIR